MTNRQAILVSRICDALLPGAGMILAGKNSRGMGVMILWSIVPALMSTAICALNLHPIKGLIITGILWAVVQVFLLVEPLGELTSPLKTARAVTSSVIFIIFVAVATSVGIGRQCTVVPVADFGTYPGLLPGELVLAYRFDFAKNPPKRGDLVVARDENGPVIARVAAIGGDRIEIRGASVRVNELPIFSDSLGDLPLEYDDPQNTDESPSLQAFVEHLGEHQHVFFYRRGTVMAPSTHEVPAGQVFLLSDNRTTKKGRDSRTFGPVGTDTLIGRPVKVIWSPGLGPFPRWQRIGSLWF